MSRVTTIADSVIAFVLLCGTKLLWELIFAHCWKNRKIAKIRTCKNFVSHSIRINVNGYSQSKSSAVFCKFVSVHVFVSTSVSLKIIPFVFLIPSLPFLQPEIPVWHYLV